MERMLLNVGSFVDEGGLINEDMFAADLGATAKETSLNKPYWKRVHSYFLTKVDADWIIDARRGDKHIDSFYSGETPFDLREKVIGLELANTLVKYPSRTIAVHISPPGGPLNYPEGRIQVGLNRKEMGITFSEWYGIPTPFNNAHHLYMGYSLSEISEGTTPKDSESLRDHIFIIECDEEVNPWDLLSKRIPLQYVWEKIKSGQIIEETRETHNHAVEAVKETLKDSPKVMNSWDAIRIGAVAEENMGKRGYQITSAECGVSNSDILNKYLITLQGSTKIDQNGQITYWVNYCGKCCATIKDWIKDGYVCESCGGVYRR
jgi:rRNA maturation endonuclease Nob1